MGKLIFILVIFTVVFKGLKIFIIKPKWLTESLNYI